tara:strand:- start:14790 stop:14966 length:177 start_codon:yes stop_codon:yes gene_type:complete
MMVTKQQKIKKLKRQKPSLYRNVNLVKLGAGKSKKRKKGAKGAPTDSAFKKAAKTAKA